MRPDRLGKEPMSWEQLELFNERSEVGEECAHFGGYLAGHVRCMRGATPTYTNCNESFCGEPPRCVFSPIDNSDAACKRRREWMKRNGGNN